MKQVKFNETPRYIEKSPMGNSSALMGASKMSFNILDNKILDQEKGPMIRQSHRQSHGCSLKNLYNQEYNKDPTQNVMLPL